MSSKIEFVDDEGHKFSSFNLVEKKNVSKQTMRLKRPLLKSYDDDVYARSSQKDVLVVSSKNITKIKIGDTYAMEWALPNYGDYPTLAVGNDRAVTIVSIGSSLRTVRFQPKFLRPCVCISWNRKNESIIAAGFKRAKDYCLQIWDAKRSGGSTSQYTPISPGIGDRATRTTSNHSAYTIHPIQKLCKTEECASTEWLSSSPMCLAVGLENGVVRVYDLQVRGRSNVIREFRAHEKDHVVRAVASKDHMLATFSDDGTVKIWDIRKIMQKKTEFECISSLFYSSTSNRTITQISWIDNHHLGT